MDLTRRQIIGAAGAGLVTMSTGLIVPDSADAVTRPTLKLGSTGKHVKYLQSVLKEHHYWLDRIDSRYEQDTQQAVMAFQKMHGLPRDGVCGPKTWVALKKIYKPRPRSAASAGRVIEVNLSRQVIIMSNNGKGGWVYNTSTGSNQYYTVNGITSQAVTPRGRFTILRQVNGMRVSRLGELWRPKYFTTSGIALHGSKSIPGYPASHGCCRLSNMAINHIWSSGQAPIGRKVWVY